MKKKKSHSLRRCLLAGLCMGTLFQTSACSLLSNPAVRTQVVDVQTANILTDTIAFLLDNWLVRLNH